MSLKIEQQANHSALNNPVDIKLVEECKIDVENIQEGLEHKLFYQSAVKQIPQKIRLQKIAEKKASLTRAKAELAKKWWFVKPENILHECWEMLKKTEKVTEKLSIMKMIREVSDEFPKTVWTANTYGSRMKTLREQKKRHRTVSY